MTENHSQPVKKAEIRQISKATGLWIAVAALCSGATAAGGAHYLSTAKKLSEEGVDPLARVRAVPLAVKALVVSTAATATVGTAALVAMRCAGIDFRERAEVTTWRDAIRIGQQHRDIIRGEFQKRLQKASEGPGQ